MSASLLSRLWPALFNAVMRLRTLLPPLQTLTGREGRVFRAWVAALECVARKAVLIEAKALGPMLMASRSRRRPELKALWTPPRKAPPSLRLWRPARPGPRARLLGPPNSMREVWLERRRAALAARLVAARTKRKPGWIRLGDRLDALERLIAAPGRAARRLARKLLTAPSLAADIAAALNSEPRGLDAELIQEVWAESLDVAFPNTG